MPNTATSSSKAVLDPLVANERYRYHKTLEWGSSHSVLLAEDRTQPGLMVAVILIECGETVPPQLEMAIKNHGSLRHPHVLAFHHVFAIPGFVAIAVEYPEEGSLLRYVERCSREQSAPVQETLSRWFFQQVALALQYCHRKGVACGDIRLENVLLQRGALLPLAKLCGFGYSRTHRGSHTADRMQEVMPDYMPPESIAHEYHDDPMKGDIWSLGIVLYTMMTGSFPFSSVPIAGTAVKPPREEVLRRIRKSQLRFPSWVPDTCQYLISRCLETDPSKRTNIDDIMNDAWFVKDFPKQARTLNDYILAAESGRPIQIRSTPHVSKRNINAGMVETTEIQWESKIKNWLDEAMLEEDSNDQGSKDSTQCTARR